MIEYRRRKAERFLVYIASPVMLFENPSLSSPRHLSEGDKFYIGEKVWNSQAQHFDRISSDTEELKGYISLKKLYNIYNEKDIDSGNFLNWLSLNSSHPKEEEILWARNKIAEITAENELLDRFDKIITCRDF